MHESYFIFHSWKLEVVTCSLSSPACDSWSTTCPIITHQPVTHGLPHACYCFVDHTTCITLPACYCHSDHPTHVVLLACYCLVDHRHHSTTHFAYCLPACYCLTERTLALALLPACYCLMDRTRHTPWYCSSSSQPYRRASRFPSRPGTSLRRLSLHSLP